MISGLYSAATAMDAASVRHESSAENLAFAHLPGFRRRIVHQTDFSTTLREQANAAHYSPTLGTTVGTRDTPNMRVDFSRGSLKNTGRPLDLALDDEGFFVVEGPNGPLYTRNGAFIAHPDGQLVTVDGLPVSGRNGPVQIPVGTSSDIIEITRDGRLLANGIEFDELEVVQFENIGGLKPVGASLFQPAPGTEPEDADPSVLQGFVESSNVSQMDELINIMIASRQYEAAQKALNMIDRSLDRNISGN